VGSNDTDDELRAYPDDAALHWQENRNVLGDRIGGGVFLQRAGL
jgi:hypothetical protein